MHVVFGATGGAGGALVRELCWASSTRTSNGRTSTPHWRTSSHRSVTGDELEEALERRARLGLSSELEEVVGGGERVMVVVRTPGLDAHRVRQSEDRNFSVLTVRGGHIVAMRDCRDREEVMPGAGIG